MYSRGTPVPDGYTINVNKRVSSERGEPRLPNECWKVENEVNSH